MTVWVRQKLFSRSQSGKKLLAIFVLLAMLLTTLQVLISPANATPSTTKTISFSARLKGADGTTVPDGYYNVSFRLYTASKAGSAIWAETFYDENGTAAGKDYRIKVTGGYLNAKLGSRTAFGSSVNWEDNLWLTMNIGGTGQIAATESIPWDGEMSPRIQLSAVPYAMNAGLLGGKAAGDFIQLGQGLQTNSSDNPTINLNTTGKGDLIQLQKDAENVFTVDNDGNILFGSGSDHTIAIEQSEDGEDGHTLAITGGDGGDGTTNGGNVVISGGSGSGGGADGLVVLATTAFATATNDSNCYAGGTLASSSCTISQSTVDGSSAVIIGFNQADQVATLPDPELATPGRILYIMAANDSLPLTLLLNADEPITMKPKSALTLLWNGSDWVVAGHIGAASNIPQDPAITEGIPTPEEDLTIEDGSAEEGIGIENSSSDGDADTPEASDQSDTDDNPPFQLGQAESAPPASPGSMYYDTTLGKIQCYEADGWGSCGDAPDTFVTISPEYTNAVMNGTDIGVISSDFCSGSLGINDGSGTQPTVCAPNETYNFYRWTTQEDTDQTRSIYLTYQLPENFKGFVPESTSIMGRTNSDDSLVDYQVYRDNGSGLLSCGTLVSVSEGLQSSWQKGLAEDESDPASCDFEAGDSILFRINLTARDASNAYVSNVNFIFRNN